MNIHLQGVKYDGINMINWWISVMKGLKQLTAFGYATKIPIEISF